MKHLKKIIPSCDKLKHFYLGTLSFSILSILFSFHVSLIIVFVIAASWEINQKLRGGKNDLKEMALDILFSCVSGILITIV